MKPRVFIGSSVEALDIAYAIQENLDYDANVTVWNQGVFELSINTIDSLIKVVGDVDFGIFIFQPDDIININSKQKNTVRDNVLFELGLFIGRLGKEKVFFVTPKNSDNFHLPSDLLGITSGKYDNNREDGNLKAAIGSFCNQVRNQIKDYVYTSVNDLSNESIEAKRIAIEKPLGWEHLLSAELLRNKLYPVVTGYDELEKKLLFIKAKHFTADDYKDWFRDRVTEMVRFGDIIIGLLENLQRSYGSQEESGNILDIKNATDKLVSYAKELLAWEFRVQEAEPPDELIGVKNNITGWTRIYMDEIQKLPLIIENNVRCIINGEDKSHHMKLTFKKMDNIESVTRIFIDYYSNL